MQVLGEQEVALTLDRAALAACSGPNLERALVAGALLPLNVAKGMCPVLTGNLRRSLHIGGHSGLTGGLPEGASDLGGNVTGPASATILVGTNLDYAEAVECGSSAHDIRPKNAQALFWPGAAHPVKIVHHPGTAPQPYLRPAFDGAAPVITAEMARAIHLMLAAAL